MDGSDAPDMSPGLSPLYNENRLKLHHPGFVLPEICGQSLLAIVVLAIEDSVFPRTVYRILPCAIKEHLPIPHIVRAVIRKHLRYHGTIVLDARGFSHETCDVFWN